QAKNRGDGKNPHGPAAAHVDYPHCFDGRHKTSVHSERSRIYPLVNGKPVQIRRGPATVSAEGRPKEPLFPRGMGRPGDPERRESGDRPARWKRSALEGGAANAYADTRAVGLLSPF